MKKKKHIDYLEILHKTEQLFKATSNRYNLTCQIAERAKKKKYVDIDILNDSTLKPIIQAIIEMEDEVNKNNSSKEQ